MRRASLAEPARAKTVEPEPDIRLGHPIFVRTDLIFDISEKTGTTTSSKRLKRHSPQKEGFRRKTLSIVSIFRLFVNGE